MNNLPVESVLFEEEFVRVERLALGACRLVMKKPDSRNVISPASIAEWTRALRLIEQTADARALLVASSGPVFSAGADLNYMKELARADFDTNVKDSHVLSDLFFALASAKMPVVGAVRGAAIGGGLGIAACCDLVVADTTAVFATTEVLLGIVPAVISPYVARKIGLAAAQRMFFLGRRTSAEEALACGLVTQVTTPEALDEACEDLLLELLCASPDAQRRTKELLLESAPLPAEDTRQRLAETIAAARASKEGQMGLSCFFEKKVPEWAKSARALLDKKRGPKKGKGTP